MVWTVNDLGRGGVFGFDIRDRRRPVRVVTLRDPGFVDAIAADRGVLLVGSILRLPFLANLGG